MLLPNILFNFIRLRKPNDYMQLYLEWYKWKLPYLLSHNTYDKIAPSSLIHLNPSFVSCFKNITISNILEFDPNSKYLDIATATSFVKSELIKTQDKNIFDQMLDSKSQRYTPIFPCNEIGKYPQCSEYCMWHKNYFSKWTKKDFSTIMRYALPQRKFMLDPILPTEKK